MPQRHFTKQRPVPTRLLSDELERYLGGLEKASKVKQNARMQLIGVFATQPIYGRICDRDESIGDLAEFALEHLNDFGAPNKLFSEKKLPKQYKQKGAWVRLVLIELLKGELVALRDDNSKIWYHNGEWSAIAGLLREYEQFLEKLKKMRRTRSEDKRSRRFGRPAYVRA